MTPHKQLYRHDPDNGVYGDCQRTAIACLLDRRPEDVPHFMEDGVLPEVADKRIDDWLTMLNLKMIFVPFQGELADVMDMQARFMPGLHYLLVGKSRTGVGHVVVCKDRDIVHDPSQNDSGIIGPCEESGMYWIQYLGARV